MIKIGCGPDGKPEADYRVVERESPAIYRTRSICVALMRSGIKVWLKGKRDSYVIPYEQLFIDAERGSVSIKPRRISAAELAKFKLKQITTDDMRKMTTDDLLKLKPEE